MPLYFGVGVPRFDCIVKQTLLKNINPYLVQIRLVLKVPYVSLADRIKMKEEWKCAAMECGEQSVMVEDTGTPMIQL